MPVELTTTQGVRDGSLCLIAFHELALRDALPEIRRVQFPVAGPAPSQALPLGEVLLNELNPFGAGMLLRAEDGMLIALEDAGDCSPPTPACRPARRSRVC